MKCQARQQCRQPAPQQHCQAQRQRQRPALLQAGTQNRQLVRAAAQPDGRSHTLTVQENAAMQRRQLLLGGVAAGAVLAAPAPASQAAVTVTLRQKAQLKPYTLKAGYSVTVPDSWGLAYDRSADEKSGTQAFFGNFRTFETLAISRLARPEGDLSPQQLLDWVLAEQKNNQSTYDFQLLSGDTPTQRTAPAADAAAAEVFYDSEYSLAICRGVIQEGAGGSKRCIGPRDMDLEVVSRTFYQTFTVRQDSIYIVRGSSTTQQWRDVRAAAQEAVLSFRLPAALT